jgi:hypothetical protein
MYADHYETGSFKTQAVTSYLLVITHALFYGATT